MSNPSQLYVMIKPPLAACRQLCACRAAQGLDDHYWEYQFHGTMLRLGSYLGWSSSQLAHLRSALGTICADPFEVAFDQLEGRLLRGRKGMAGAKRFHERLRDRAKLCGVQLPVHNFWLHLTLAYEGPAVEGIRKIDPIGWLVDEFLLVHSIKGQHRVLDRWPLARRQYGLAL